MKENFIHPTAEIHPSVEIGEGNIIGPYCRIHEGVVIMNNCTLTRCLIKKGTLIGNNVYIHGDSLVGELCILGHGTVLCEKSFVDDDIDLPCGYMVDGVTIRKEMLF